MELNFDGVRLATKTDEDELFGLLMLMHSECPVFSFDRDLVRAGIKSATERTGGLIGVIEGPKRIEATIGLKMGPGAWFTKDYALHDMWNFVHPDHRRSTHAKRLIRFAKHCSTWFEEQGSHLPLQVGVYSTVRTEAKCRLYRRQLMPIGQYYMFDPAAVASPSAVA